MRTSGATVVFSGITVIVSLAGLFLIDSTVMRSLAIGAIIVVAISIIGAVTLLPALIALLGRRADERGKIVGFTGAQLSPRQPQARAAGRADVLGELVDAVMRRPWLSAVVASAILLALAIPALSLEFGNGALRQFPPDNETRGAPSSRPSRSRPASPHRADRRRLRRARLRPATRPRSSLHRRLKATDGVARVDDPVALRRRQGGADQGGPRAGPGEPRRRSRSSTRLRAEGGQASGITEVATVEVGGASAQTRDFTDQISGGLWKIFLFVLICSYLVLLVVLRSVILPLKAVLMNLLTVGAAYGVMVMFFQYGWFDWTGFNHLGYVNAITPPLLLAIVFGLSMDYEVFLLSRIQERYQATGDNRRAVAEGLQAQRQGDHQRRADHGRRLLASSPSPACRRSRRSASACRSRSRSTPRSYGSCSCRRRWS